MDAVCTIDISPEHPSCIKDQRELNKNRNVERVDEGVQQQIRDMLQNFFQDCGPKGQ